MKQTLGLGRDLAGATILGVQTMGRLLAIFAIGLGLGGGFGFLGAASTGVTLEGHDHDAHGHEANAAASTHHHDAKLDISAAAAPALSIQLSKDPVSGWNLNLTTENFRFAPDQAGYAHVPNQGHAHVYVNGSKIARLYGPWMHIGSLPENAQVEVTLNANDHRLFSVDGQAIRAVTSSPGTQ